MMQAKQVKIIENIATKDQLDLLVGLWQAENPIKLGWRQQPDGRYCLEVEMNEVAVGESAVESRQLILE